MRAKYVFEKFKEESDPIKDMGIGYKKRILNSKTWKLLEFIKSKGEKGVGFTEIQYYIWTELNHNDPDKFWEKRFDRYSNTELRRSRGYWNTALLGGHKYRGILHRFCKKNPLTKKWVFVRFPEPQEKLYYKN